MAYNIEFLPGAETDLDEVIDWYQQINAPLASDFFIKLDEALLTIRVNPQQFQKVYKTYRKFNLKRFPYKVIYRVEKQSIIVVAIAHHKRKIRYWKGRE
jgi:plasmid stabilization system protein ParE